MCKSQDLSKNKEEIATNNIGVVNFSAADISSWSWKEYFELIYFLILLWILFKWICKKHKKRKQEKDVRNIQKLADPSAQIPMVPARTSNMHPAVTFEPQSGSRVVFMRERPALENIGSVDRISEDPQQRISGIQQDDTQSKWDQFRKTADRTNKRYADIMICDTYYLILIFNYFQIFRVNKCKPVV